MFPAQPQLPQPKYNIPPLGTDLTRACGLQGEMSVLRRMMLAAKTPEDIRSVSKFYLEIQENLIAHDTVKQIFAEAKRLLTEPSVLHTVSLQFGALSSPTPLSQSLFELEQKWRIEFVKQRLDSCTKLDNKTRKQLFDLLAVAQNLGSAIQAMMRKPELRFWYLHEQTEFQIGSNYQKQKSNLTYLEEQFHLRLDRNRKEKRQDLLSQIDILEHNKPALLDRQAAIILLDFGFSEMVNRAQFFSYFEQQAFVKHLYSGPVENAYQESLQRKKSILYQGPWMMGQKNEIDTYLRLYEIIRANGHHLEHTQFEIVKERQGVYRLTQTVALADLGITEGVAYNAQTQTVVQANALRVVTKPVVQANALRVVTKLTTEGGNYSVTSLNLFPDYVELLPPGQMAMNYLGQKFFIDSKPGVPNITYIQQASIPWKLQKRP